MKPGMRIVSELLLIDTRAQAVYRDADREWINLTGFEWRVFMAIADGRGRVVTTRDLLRSVWKRGHRKGAPIPPVVRRVTQRIRQKVGASNIRLVRGHGYRLGVTA